MAPPAWLLATIGCGFDAPVGHSITLSNQGGDDAADSDADPVSGLASVVTLASGDNNPTIDAGVLRPASLGDVVWEDLNGDGVPDAGQLGWPASGYGSWATRWESRQCLRY